MNKSDLKLIGIAALALFLAILGATWVTSPDFPDDDGIDWHGGLPPGHPEVPHE